LVAPQPPAARPPAAWGPAAWGPAAPRVGRPAGPGPRRRCERDGWWQRRRRWRARCRWLDGQGWRRRSRALRAGRDCHRQQRKRKFREFWHC